MAALFALLLTGVCVSFPHLLFFNKLPELLAELSMVLPKKSTLLPSRFSTVKALAPGPVSSKASNGPLEIATAQNA